MKQKLINGDCIEELKKLPDNSIDSIVTDPPYELGFMGKEWDKSGIANNPKLWKEALRVLKPGGHILSFGGTRTYHRMAVAIEDAGFEIRDCIFWCYGSGFPKSHNIGKAIDKKLGNKRKVVGERTDGAYSPGTANQGINEYTALKLSKENNSNPKRGEDFGKITKGNSKWEGWGTALKPAVEPIVLGRKPLSEKTIVDNVLKHGTGGINIDDSRVTLGDNEKVVRNFNDFSNQYGAEVGIGKIPLLKSEATPQGRFPANLILECICDEVIEGKEEVVSIHDAPTGTFAGGEQDRGSIKNYRERNVGKTIIHTNPDCPCYVLDEQSGDLSRGKKRIVKGGGHQEGGMVGGKSKKIIPTIDYGDKGGASRFFKEIEGDRIFYAAKASKSERNNGLEGFEEKPGGALVGNNIETQNPGNKIGAEPNKQVQNTKNNHPTVKPVKLMKYLIKLITPPNGTVLDPFMGSGTTGVAAKLEGFNFVGIEKEEEYIKIAEARIKNYKENPKKKTKPKKKKVKKVKSKFWK